LENIPKRLSEFRETFPELKKFWISKYNQKSQIIFRFPEIKNPEIGKHQVKFCNANLANIIDLFANAVSNWLKSLVE